jgi:hypothetical protein
MVNPYLKARRWSYPGVGPGRLTWSRRGAPPVGIGFPCQRVLLDVPPWALNPCSIRRPWGEGSQLSSARCAMLGSLGLRSIAGRPVQ